MSEPKASTVLLPRINILMLPLLSRKKIAKDTIEITLGLQKQPFVFLAGQYLRLTFSDISYEILGGNYRDFSIVSSPKDRGVLRVATRISDSVFKRELQRVRLGSKLKVSGPFGDFALPPGLQSCIMIAGGIGVTPLLSQIRYATETKSKRRIFLLYANENHESAAYLPELEELQKQNKRFTFKTVFGQVKKEHLEAIPDQEGAQWRIVGSEPMTKAVMRFLKQMDVATEDIYQELHFVSYQPLGTWERRLIEEPKRRVEALLTALNRLALVSETDPEGTITYVNDKFVEISKYSRDELVGQNPRVLKSGHQSHAFYQEMWKTISSGKPWRGQVKDRAKDGTYYWIDTGIAPIVGKHGEIERYIGVHFPITGRKKLEEELTRRLVDVERMNKVMVGRELKMIELKKQLKMALGKTAKPGKKATLKKRKSVL